RPVRRGPADGAPGPRARGRGDVVPRHARRRAGRDAHDGVRSWHAHLLPGPHVLGRVGAAVRDARLDADDRPLPAARRRGPGPDGRLVRHGRLPARPGARAGRVDARADPARRAALPLELTTRSEEHTSELHSREKLVYRLLLETKNV